jgi:O-antigen/teichoic acid export membrane protein
VKFLWQSATLRTVGVYTASGFGFAGANLILARVLPAVEYGLVTLVIALVNLGFSLATLGLDGVVNRRHVEAGPDLLRRSAGAALVVGLGLAATGFLLYKLPLAIVLAIFVCTVAGGIMMVAAAKFQSEQRFGISLSLSQSPNLVLLVAALILVLTGSRTAWHPIAILAAGFVVAALVGWWFLRCGRWGRTSTAQFSWTEALSFAGLNAAGLILLQLDRLLIPHLLSVQDLATYGVLAAIAGSLFRMLSLGVGYTLVPQLRAADSVGERRRLISREARLVSVVLVAGVAALWLITPWIERWVLADKYHLSWALLLAAIISGMVRVTNAFTKSVVSALATTSELAWINVLGWGAVALAVVAAFAGARWGLAGVIYGVTMGGVMRALTALYFAVRHLRLPRAIPATAAR